MTLKLIDLLEINNILKLIIDNDKLSVEPLLKFRLLGIMKNIEIPIMNFETIRNEKIREYGKYEDGNYNISKDDKDAVDKFTKDMDTIVNSNVDVNIQKLKPNDVFDKGLPAEYLVGLYSIIEE